MFMNAIIAGLLYFLSFPPYDFWYLIFPALYLFYYSLLSSKKSFLSGFIFGCVAYGVILLGIQSIGLEAWIPLTFLMGLMYGVFSKLFSYLNTKSGNNFYVSLAALAVFDLIRAYFPFGGGYTDAASAAIADCMKHDDRVTVMTAAMCQGNKLEAVREAFPDRFFDVGICESHAVAFAAGQAKAGCRPCNW